jgi:murein DD-endopeptidase MepM/ murein hydrolase activator NlpD
MPSHKYLFNPETLSFVKARLTFVQKLIIWGKSFLISVGLAIVYYLIFSSFFQTPRIQKLNREKEEILIQFELFKKKFDYVSSVLEDIQQRDDNIYRTIFEAQPISPSIRQAGIGGSNRYTEYEGYSNSKTLIETAKTLDKLSKQLYIQTKSFDDIIVMAKNKEEMIASIPAIQPISYNGTNQIVSLFGPRILNQYRVWHMHKGVDLTAKTGTEIYATGNGVVVRAESSLGGFGKVVVIDHGYGYKTLYAHLSKIKVTERQVIKRGEVIGLVGNTGFSFGSHLHYEVHKNGVPINPINFFLSDVTPEEYKKIIEYAMKNEQQLD